MEHLDAHPGLRAAAIVWILLFGAVVGSFLNVVIARVPRGRSVVRPRSSCPSCGALIAWYDNVPVLSWIHLRGRCRACGARISLRYPLVEVLGAVAALLAVARHGPGGAAAAELAFTAALVALAFIDLDTWLLPHAITWPLIGAGVLASLLGGTAAGGVTSSVIGASAGFGAFALVAIVGARVFHREALGWGDVWLLAGIGAWLGVRALIPVVLFASLQGSVLGVALLLLGRGQPGPPPDAGGPPAAETDGAGESGTTSGGEEAPWVPPKNAVPFGPFLALAALEWLYLGGVIRDLVPVLEVFR